MTVEAWPEGWAGCANASDMIADTRKANPIGKRRQQRLLVNLAIFGSCQSAALDAIAP
jgi:hypothetical protein